MFSSLAPISSTRIRGLLRSMDWSLEALFNANCGRSSCSDPLAVMVRTESPISKS